VLSDIGYQQKNVIGTWSFSYFSDALRHFEKAYTLNPNYTNTLVWLGISYLDLNNYDKAHTALDVALSKDQTLWDAWYYKGKVYLAEAKDKEAIATFKKLLTIDPRYELAKQELTLLELKNKQ
jgi:tetratricopeptide (TPR) repeat protein